MSTKTKSGVSVQNGHIIVKTKHGDYIRVPLDYVIFFERMKTGYIDMVTTDKRYSLGNLTLKEILELIAEYGFCRTHKSFIVNLARVKVISEDGDRRYKLAFDDSNSEQAYVSRHFRKDFEQKIGLIIH